MQRNAKRNEVEKQLKEGFIRLQIIQNEAYSLS